MQIKKQYHTILLLVAVLIIYFSFGLTHLTKFVSFDEHYWLYNSDDDRIHQYWNAILSGDWKDTRINDKPGITLAYTSGIALLFNNESSRGHVLYTDKTVKIFDPEVTEKINLLFRLPILIITGLFSFFFFWILKRITGNEWLALLVVALTYLSPVIIGISQIVNPDSMFWLFSFASMLSYVAWLKIFEKKYFWMTLVFFGLSMASKYVSIILIPFFLFMFSAFYLFEFSAWKDKREVLKKIVFRNSLAYIGIIAGGFLIFALMMPAVFVEPKYFYEGTIGFPGMAPIFWLCMLVNAAIAADAYFNKNRILHFALEKLQIVKKVAPKLIAFALLSSIAFVLINWMLRHRLIDLSDVSFDMKRRPEFGNLPYAYRFVMEAVPLAFASFPLVLFSMLYLWSKSIFQKVKHDYLAFIFSAFIAIFYLAVIEEGLVLTIRYSIILYPISALLAAIALDNFFKAWQEGEGDGRKFLLFIAFLFSIILLLFGASSFEQAKIISEANLRIFYNFHRVIFALIVLVVVAISTRVVYAFISWKKLRQLSYLGIFLLVISSSFISVWLIKPYYFSYSNELLPKKYIITSGWGYGGYEVAKTMNALPDAKNTTVWADSYGFCEFYVGKCIHKTKIRTDIYPIDYFYSTLQSQLRPEYIGTPYREDGKAIANIEIDGRYKNYVRIFKAKKVIQENIVNE